MCNTVGILVFHPCRVGPALRPISPHRNKRTGGNWSVVCLPFFHALERQRVIGIFCSLVVHIDDNKRQHHFFWIDLIYGAKSLYEMSRGIHMRAPLADMRIQFGEETCSHDVRTLLHTSKLFCVPHPETPASAGFPVQTRASGLHLVCRLLPEKKNTTRGPSRPSPTTTLCASTRYAKRLVSYSAFATRSRTSEC